MDKIYFPLTGIPMQQCDFGQYPSGSLLAQPSTLLARYWSALGISMEDNQQIMKVSKLVCVCISKKDGIGLPSETFTYRGHSRSENCQVVLSFPDHPENIMFYEHYENTGQSSPFRLSFMFLKGDKQGETNFDFRNYTCVKRMDISNHFETVNSIFWIVNSLVNCEKLSIYFTNENVRPSKEDFRLLSVLESKIQKNLMSKYISASVIALKIVQVENIDTALLSSVSRIDVILAYVRHFLPNLKHFSVEINGTGITYDAIKQFCETKGLLLSHKLEIIDGRITCNPTNITSTPSSGSETTSQQNASETFWAIPQRFQRSHKPKRRTRSAGPYKRKTNIDVLSRTSLSSNSSSVKNEDFLGASFDQEPETECLEQLPDLDIIPGLDIFHEEQPLPAEKEEPVAKRHRKFSTEDLDVCVVNTSTSSTGQTSIMSKSSGCFVSYSNKGFSISALSSIASTYTDWETSDDEGNQEKGAKTQGYWSRVPASPVEKNYIVGSLGNIQNAYSAKKFKHGGETGQPEQKPGERRKDAGTPLAEFVDYGTFERLKR